MRRGCILWILVWGGCDARERFVPDSPSVWVTGGPAVAIEAVSAMGQAPHATWIRSVNGYGAAVGGDATSVTVSGVSRTVSFDALGYGELTFDTVGVASITGAAASATVFTHGASFEPPGLAPVQVAPAPVTGLATRVTAGAVGASGNELWWSDVQGLHSHRVLDAGAPLVGLLAVHADVDQVLDVVAWTADTAFLLRGRTDGGLSWGGALQAPGYGLGGVGVADLSDDNVPDIAVAWVGGGPENPGLLEVWHGDGLFGFTPTEPRQLDFVPVSLAVADSTGEGQPQITVLYASGSWGRFIEGAPGRTMPIGPRAPESTSPDPGSVLVEPLDLDGDGLSEIPIGSSFDPGGPRDYLIYDLSNDSISALPIEDEPAPYMAVGDGDGDLVDDLWLHRPDGVTQVIHYEPTSPTTGTYPRSNVLGISPGPGPIDVVDLDADGHNDVWIAGPTLWWGIRGRGIGFDPERFWEPMQPDSTFVREDLDGPFRFAELAGDASSLEILAAIREGGNLEFTVLQYARDDERAERIGRVSLSGRELVDMEVCGRTAYALTDAALHAISLSDATSPSVTAQAAVTDPRDVTCGTGPGGTVVAIADGGEIVSYANGLAERDRSAVVAYGLAFADVGAGPELRSCSMPDCDLVPWTLSDGSTGFLMVDPASAVWFDAAGTGRLLGGLGDTVALADVDGDGVLDAISHDEGTGVVGLYRDIGGQVSPPYLWQSASEWHGGVGLDDADLDGVLDLWGIDADGDLRYIHTPRAQPDTSTGTTPSETGETGDTGLP